MGENYVICTGTGAPRKASLLGVAGPAEYKRDRLYEGWPSPSRSFEGVLWDGKLSEIPNGNLNNCADSDGDLYSQHSEAFQETNREDDCSATSTANDEPVDAWPPDFNDNQSVSLSDIIAIGPYFNTFAPGPPYSPRFDLNVDASINNSDLIAFGPVMNTSCN